MVSHAEQSWTRDPDISGLRQGLAEASGAQIMRIVATVDAMMSRGVADQLVAPLRPRLSVLRPPRPLRFVRLLFHPLDPLIVPPLRWRLGQHTIPRTALAPMAEHVRLTMGAAARAIEADLAGHTDAETELIVRMGTSLWSEAADILAAPDMPESWGSTELGDPIYRPLAGVVSGLLGQAAALESLWAATANGLLPPGAQAIELILTHVAATAPAALPMTIALLLTRLPQATGLLAQCSPGPDGAAIQIATGEAEDFLLRQLERDEGIEARIATGSLAEAGGSAKNIATLLRSLDTANVQPARRDTLRAMRDRLDAGCKARFALGLQDDLLMPLYRLGSSLDAAAIGGLEATARGLRVLETEARTVGSSAVYDLLLSKAAAAIENRASGGILPVADQVRLVEILVGPEAALALIGRLA